jgi:DNA-directed RNA polymerase subunit alpha
MSQPSTSPESPTSSTEAGTVGITATLIAPVPPPEPTGPQYDISAAENLSFAALQAARAQVFETPMRAQSFRRTLDALGASGEPGRRKGLGLWILGDYAGAAAQLEGYASDDVASFTRAKSLLALGKPSDALAIFERLSKAYPEEPRPRAGMLEARLERDLAKAPADTDAAAAALDKGIASAPTSFARSADAHYLRARSLELKRDFEAALDAYEEARAVDPTHREALFCSALLAERSGLDLLALECYQTLAQLRPVDRSALMNLGVLLEDLGRDQDAAACYELIVRSDATDERARLFLEDARSASSMYYDEDMERKEDRLNQILRIPITDFELSVRARNCLNKMNIATLGDLVNRSEQELLSYKNFGETSLNEIKEILGSKGLRLGMTHEEAVSSVEATARRIPDVTERTGNAGKPIGELQLSIRARRTVEQLGCITIADVMKHTADELLGMPNFGHTSLQELRAKLTELGLKLNGDP